jgi:hypothetical protein
MTFIDILFYGLFVIVLGFCLAGIWADRRQEKHLADIARKWKQIEMEEDPEKKSVLREQLKSEQWIMK